MTNLDDVVNLFQRTTTNVNTTLPLPTVAKVISFSNTTAPSTESAYSLTMAEVIIFAVLYALTVIVAITGNIMVIWIVIRTNRKKTINSTNYFIINLALVDIFILGFNVPLTLFNGVNGNEWPWGWGLCKVVWSVAVSALSANTFTFAAIMVERYQAIANPLQKYGEQRRRVHIALLIIWLLSFVTGIPTLIAYDVMVSGQRLVCGPNWLGITEFIHNVVLVIVQYIIPVVTTLITYFLIRSKLGNAHAIGDTSVGEAAGLRAKQKVVTMMMSVCVTFSVCVFPHNALILVLNWPWSNVLQEKIGWARAIIRTYLILYLFAMSNSIVNPFIYAYWSSTFRLGFKYVFRWLPFIQWDDDIDGSKFFTNRRALSVMSSYRSYNNSIQAKLRKARQNGTVAELPISAQSMLLQPALTENFEEVVH